MSISSSGSPIQDPPRRPAILIGHGAFGLRVLRRFLETAHLRGALSWTQNAGESGPAGRRLRHLHLLHVENSLAAPEDREPEREENRLRADLFQQIEQVGGESTSAEGRDRSFAEAVERAADRLLSTSSSGRLPGLDVIVVARPQSAPVVGSLDRLLKGGFDRLERTPTLRRGTQSAERLSLIGVLDFDGFWDETAEAERLRRALASSAREWQRRRTGARTHPGFGRLYLVDRQTEDGHRSEQHRLDEINLFLELLLFEGQRTQSLQHLYQARHGSESPLFTFGVRSLERRIGLLQRLAAAHFGAEWLEYLAGSRPAQEGDRPQRLERCLTSYRSPHLETLFGGEILRAVVDRGIERLTGEVATLPASSERWIERVEERYLETSRGIRERLLDEAGEQLVRISAEHLARLPEELDTAIEQDLHDMERPVPLGAVISLLEEVRRELEEHARRSARAHRRQTERRADTLGELGSLHGAYRRFLREQIRPGEIFWWWPLPSALAAAAVAPFVSELLEGPPEPSPVAHPAFVLAHRAVEWLAKPLGTGLLLFGGALGLSYLLLQSRITRRVRRSLAIFTDADRGRFIDRVRGSLAPAGSLRQPFESLRRELEAEIRSATLSQVRRVLDRALERLHRRRREMLWLRGQLQQMSSNYPDLVDGARSGARGPLVHHTTDVRMMIETSEHLQRVQAENPANHARFRPVQSDLCVFEGWSEDYSTHFLYPLDFLEKLATFYSDPFERERTSAEAGPEETAWRQTFFEFLQASGRAAPAFHWMEQEGVPAVERYCLIPPSWRDLSGLRQELADRAIYDDHVFELDDDSRAYLLTVRGAVDPDSLTGERR